MGLNLLNDGMVKKQASSMQQKAKEWLLHTNFKKPPVDEFIQKCKHKTKYLCIYIDWIVKFISQIYIK